MDVLPTELWLCDDDVVSLMRSAEPTSLWIHETDLNDPAAWIQLQWYTGQETLPVCKLLDILDINQVGCIIDQSPHFYPVYLPPIDKDVLLQLAQSLATKAANASKNYVAIPARSFKKPLIVQRGALRLSINRAFREFIGCRDLVLPRENTKHALIE